MQTQWNVGDRKFTEGFFFCTNGITEVVLVRFVDLDTWLVRQLSTGVEKLIDEECLYDTF